MHKWTGHSIRHKIIWFFTRLIPMVYWKMKSRCHVSLEKWQSLLEANACEGIMVSRDEIFCIVYCAPKAAYCWCAISIDCIFQKKSDSSWDATSTIFCNSVPTAIPEPPMCSVEAHKLFDGWIISCLNIYSDFAFAAGSALLAHCCWWTFSDMLVLNVEWCCRWGRSLYSYYGDFIQYRTRMSLDQTPRRNARINVVRFQRYSAT